MRFYICDGKACAECHPECKHTTDVAHARYFQKDTNGNYWEETETVRLPKEFRKGPDKWLSY